MEFRSKRPDEQRGHAEAILVHLDAADLSDEFWKLNERLYKEIEESGTGEFDGNEIGEGVATLFAYGPDADRLFSVIEPILKGYELCHNARVEIRYGGPGSPQNEVRL